jgi:hypothetical protein
MDLSKRLGDGLQLFLLTNAMAFPKLTQDSKVLRQTV